jgi:hypothetical protein
MTAEVTSGARVVVKNRRTRAYAGEKEHWTSDASSARCFQNAYHALYFCVSEELDGAEIVEHFPDGREVRFLRC